MKIKKESMIAETTKLQELVHNLSTITLNVNGLNSPIKRYRLIEWIKI
jgi:hypothetical protein